MPYPEPLVAPMRAELTRIGVQELTTVEAVDACFQEAEQGTMVLIVNSVCGCAAANARPAVSLAMQAPVQPDRYATVFAGQDLEATSKAREYMMGIPPSSPFIALFKDSIRSSCWSVVILKVGRHRLLPWISSMLIPSTAATARRLARPVTAVQSVRK